MYWSTDHEDFKDETQENMNKGESIGSKTEDCGMESKRTKTSKRCFSLFYIRRRRRKKSPVYKHSKRVQDPTSKSDD